MTVRGRRDVPFGCVPARGRCCDRMVAEVRCRHGTGRLCSFRQVVAAVDAGAVPLGACDLAALFEVPPTVGAVERIYDWWFGFVEFVTEKKFGVAALAAVVVVGGAVFVVVGGGGGESSMSAPSPSGVSDDDSFGSGNGTSDVDGDAAVGEGRPETVFVPLTELQSSTLDFPPVEVLVEPSHVVADLPDGAVVLGAVADVGAVVVADDESVSPRCVYVFEGASVIVDGCFESDARPLSLPIPVERDGVAVDVSVVVHQVPRTAAGVVDVSTEGVDVGVEIVDGLVAFTVVTQQLRTPLTLSSVDAGTTVWSATVPPLALRDGP